MIHVETIAVGQFQVNCYIVWADAKAAIVIDPGDDIPLIEAALDRHDLTIASYMMTHGHMDHISGLAELSRRRPAIVGIPDAEMSWAFTEVNQMLPWYGTPETPDRIDRRFRPDEHFDDGGIAYRVIGTPGHTPGGVCFYMEDEAMIFVGDSLFAGSAGRTDLPGGDSRALTASLKILVTLPDNTTVYPGHGPATSIGAEKQSNFFMQFPSVTGS